MKMNKYMEIPEIWYSNRREARHKEIKKKKG